MGASSSKPATNAAVKSTSRALPRRSPSAAPLAPFVEPSSNVEAPRDDGQGKDVKFHDMILALRVRTTDVSASEFGYAAANPNAVERKPRALRAGLLTSRELREALERQRSNGFAASAMREGVKSHPNVCAQTLANTLAHVRAHVLRDVDGATPGSKIVVGEWDDAETRRRERDRA